MPNPEGRHRYQPALVWDWTGTSDLGQPTVSATPREISVQMADSRSVQQASNKAGVSLDAVVIVAQEEDIDNFSRLALGTLDVWNESGSAENDSQLYEVKKVDNQPDIRNRAVFKTLGLMRCRNPR